MIDTYIGVLIYISGQVFLGAPFSEDAVLNLIQKSIDLLSEKFFSFQYQLSPSPLFTPEGSEDGEREEKSDDIHSLLPQTILSDDLRKKQNLVRFISKEPSMFRPKPFRRSLLNDFLSLDLRASHAMMVLEWSLNVSRQEKNVEGSSEDGLQSIHTHFSHILVPLQEELKNTGMFVNSACQHMRYLVKHLKEVNRGEKLQRSLTFEEFLRKRQLQSARNSDVSLLIESDEEELSGAGSLKRLLSKHAHVIKRLTCVYWEEEARRVESGKVTELCAYESAKENMSAALISSHRLVSCTEIKVVNSVLCSIKDLLDALEGMVLDVGRMRAFRELHGAVNDPT